MTLQDTYETQKFGPSSDDKWEEVSDFSSINPPSVHSSFDTLRSTVVGDARVQVEQAFIDMQHKADENRI